MVKVAITGATGFVGSSLIKYLAGFDQFSVFGVGRRALGRDDFVGGYYNVGEFTPRTDWLEVLEGVNVLVHTAGRAHVMKDGARESLNKFRLINVDSTINLARQAALAGVKRFIFISSIKVNGEETPLDQPYRVADPPAPLDPYGISKLEAELALWSLGEKAGMEIVIIRPPLIYGPGVRGNFFTMMRWLVRGVPFPFGGIENRRSLLGINNLIDFIRICITHPSAGNQTFFVSDGEDLSTIELMSRLGKKLGTPAKLFLIPLRMLKAGALLLGKREMLQRISGSLQVDISKSREVLSWAPPFSVDYELSETAKDFLVKHSRSPGQFS